jgi:hypothetical protein
MGLASDHPRVGSGIWLLGGGSHHSVLVEFNDHLTLIERRRTTSGHSP